MLVLNTLPSIPIVPLKTNTSEETIRNEKKLYTKMHN
jgi:hypothetical protein